MSIARDVSKLLLVAALLVVFGGTAAADPVALGPLTVGHYSQQDHPCFIGYSCGTNLGLAYTDYPGGAEGVVLSPTYTVSQLTALVGATPLIAIDINQNQNNPDYNIEWIKVYVNGEVAFQFGAPHPTTVQQTETGNGLSDYVISGLNFAGFTGTETIWFEVNYGNASGTLGDNNDGKETFFLVSAQQVPEPTTLLLLGSGLLAACLIRWGYTT